MKALHRPGLLLLLLPAVACGIVDGATCDDKREYVSTLEQSICVDLFEDGEHIRPSTEPYGDFITAAVFQSMADDNALASCRGRSYDFSLDEQVVRVTVDVREEGESVLPPLDLREGSTIRIEYEPFAWGPDRILLRDGPGVVFLANRQRGRFGPAAEWLERTRGVELETYCTLCGTYGVYETTYRTRESALRLKPGETGSITHGGRDYGVASIENTSQIGAGCTDAYGTSRWAIWRIPE